MDGLRAIRAGPESAANKRVVYGGFAAGPQLQAHSRLLQELPWQKLNDFLVGIEAERSLAAFSHRVLREIGALIPYDDGSVLAVDPRAPNRPLLFIDYRTEASSEHNERAAEADSCPKQALNRRLRESELSHNFARRHGLHTLAIGNLTEATLVGFVVVLHRLKRFNELEMAVCAVLRPHLHNLFCLIFAPEEARRSRLTAAAGACGLTGRETEVALNLNERLSAEEIAQRLYISRRTVEKHIEHIYLKLQVHNRRGLREQADSSGALARPMRSRRTGPKALQASSLQIRNSY